MKCPHSRRKAQTKKNALKRRRRTAVTNHIGLVLLTIMKTGEHELLIYAKLRYANNSRVIEIPEETQIMNRY